MILHHFIIRCLVLMIMLPGFLYLYANEPAWQITALDSFPGKKTSVVKIVKGTAIDVDVEGNVYIIDGGRHQLLKFTSGGRLLKQIGGFGQGEDQFDDPRDVYAHTTLDVFVADYNNNRVVRYDKNLNFLSSFTSAWPEPFDFERILSVAVSSQYDLFLLEDDTKQILKFSRFSEPKEAFGGIYATYGQLVDPVQMTLDGSQKLFVADPGQKTVVVFDYLGNFITKLYHPELQYPVGLFWSSNQQLFVADSDNANIFVFNERLKFSGLISLGSYLEQIVDIAVKYNKNSRSTQLLVLTPTLCRVFVIHLIKN